MSIDLGSGITALLRVVPMSSVVNRQRNDVLKNNCLFSKAHVKASFFLDKDTGVDQKLCAFKLGTFVTEDAIKCICRNPNIMIGKVLLEGAYNFPLDPTAQIRHESTEWVLAALIVKI